MLRFIFYQPKNHYLINTASSFFPFLGGKWKMEEEQGRIHLSKKKRNPDFESASENIFKEPFTL